VTINYFFQPLVQQHSTVFLRYNNVNKMCQISPLRAFDLRLYCIIYINKSRINFAIEKNTIIVLVNKRKLHMYGIKRTSGNRYPVFNSMPPKQKHIFIISKNHKFAKMTKTPLFFSK
jgi:hypothetical protein